MSNWTYLNFACADEPDGSVRIVKYGGSDSIVFIPTFIENRPVKIIGHHAFVDNKIIEEVILPLKLEIIEEFAFSYCYSLKKVIIPKSVKIIGKRAFSRCRSLNDIRMPSIMDIGRGAFTTVPGFPDITSGTDSMINERIEELGLSVPDKVETAIEGDENEMVSLMEAFCNQDEKNYLEIPLQTGSGKTYASRILIENFVRDYDAGKKPLNGIKRIIYTTPLKNNLPWKQIKKALGDDFYNKYVMYVEPIGDLVLRGYDELDSLEKTIISKHSIEGWNNLEDCIAKYNNPDKISTSVIQHLSDDRNLTNQFAQLISDTKKKAIEDFNRAEAIFRRNLRRTYSKAQSAYMENFGVTDPVVANDYLLSSSDWSWLRKLYPSVDTDHKIVFFMSVAKLINVHDPIVSSKFITCNSDLLENSLVIIDEVDAAKIDIIKSIISGNQDDDFRKVEPIEMFRAIRNSIRTKSEHIPSIYKKIGSDGEEGSFDEFASKVLESADSIEKEFCLDKRFVYEGDEEVHFLFHDFHVINIGKGSTFYISKNGANYISTSNDIDFEQDTENIHYLDAMFTKLENFFNYFEAFINNLALNLFNKRKKSSKPLSIESSIRSILAVFELEDNYDRVIENAIMSGGFNRNISHDTNDMSFYNKGFRYYSIENSNDHAETTRLYRTAYNETPEKIMMNMATRSGIKIIGISATASIDSIISNFDKEYMFSLDSPLKKYVLQDADIQRLNKMYERATEYYRDNIDIRVERIDDKDFDAENLTSPRNVMALNKLIDNKVKQFAEYYHKEPDKVGYVGDRYKRFALAYRRFIEVAICEKDPIYSELALFNIQVTESKPDFNRDVLENICNLVLSAFDDSVKEMFETKFFVLRGGENFDGDKEVIFDHLKNHGKAFILSTYPTVGSGQNLQYPIPKGMEPIHTNRYDESNYKDIDAIYLDDLTRIITQVVEGEPESRDRHCYEVEELNQTGELTLDETEEHVRFAFKRCAGIPSYSSTLKSTDSFILASARAIIQGIGRICRTNMKNPVIYIFYDSNIEGHFRLPIDSYGKMRSREFETFYYKVQEGRSRPTKSYIDGEKKDIASAKAATRIDALLKARSNHEETFVDRWKQLRETVLTYPTAGSYTDNRPIPVKTIPSLYTKLQKDGSFLQYHSNSMSEDDSFRDVTIGVGDGSKVSEQDCNLDVMMKIPEVKQYFQEHGYATSFAPGKYILSPALYNRIYKGALGEAAGCAILERIIGLPQLQDLPTDIYEFFDFVLKDGVYIDFKNWNGPMDQKREFAQSEKTISKLEHVNGKRIFVINIIKPEGNFQPLYRSHDGRVIEIPYLYDKNLNVNSMAFDALREELGD